MKNKQNNSFTVQITANVEDSSGEIPSKTIEHIESLWYVEKAEITKTEKEKTSGGSK